MAECLPRLSTESGYKTYGYNSWWLITRLFRERFLRESWAVSIHVLHFRMLGGYEHPAHANQAFNLHREGMQGLQDAVWFRSGLV